MAHVWSSASSVGWQGVLSWRGGRISSVTRGTGYHDASASIMIDHPHHQHHDRQQNDQPHEQTRAFTKLYDRNWLAVDLGTVFGNIMQYW